MTVSIRKILATLPTGDFSAHDLTFEELGRYLSEHCNSDADKERERRHMVRDQLYADGGCKHMERVIDDVFEDQTVRELRKKWVRHSRFNNVIKRVVNESSTNYSEPAKRSVRDPAANEAYERLVQGTQFDTVMQQASRMFGLHRVVLVGPRVRVKEEDEREVVIDVVTPAEFRVVLHPNDSSRVVGYLVRTKFRSKRTSNLILRDPTWVLWTDHEKVMLDEGMMPLEQTYIEHGLGVCPWVPIKRLQNQRGFWPGEEGEDLVAGHITIWLNNILQNKETKSATKQTILQGDLTSAARGQAADTETPLELPEGAAATTVDMSMDVGLFRSNSSFVADSMANNYGMSSAYMKHQGVQSAEAREMMRVPLRELRMELQPMFLMFERSFVRTLDAVLRRDAPSLAFSIDGWKVDFGDPQTPMTPKEQLAHYKERRAAGFDNPIDYLLRQNPDLGEEDAEKFILRNIANNTWYWEQTRTLQSLGIANEASAQVHNIPGRTTSGDVQTTQRERSIADEEEATAA